MLKVLGSIPNPEERKPKNLNKQKTILLYQKLPQFLS
jgi:hypothetical protein